MVEKRCPSCGGEVETEPLGQQRELVCQDCGLVLSEQSIVVESEQRKGKEGEIME